MFPQNQWHKRVWGAFPARFSSLLVILKLILYYLKAKLCLNKSTVSTLPTQTDATLCGPTIPYIVGCYIFRPFALPVKCYILLGVVASVCTPLLTQGQKLPTLLTQQCWELLRPFARSYAVTAIMHVMKIVSSTKCQRSLRFCCLQNNWRQLEPCSSKNLVRITNKK